MAKGRARKVYFFEPVEVDENEHVTEPAVGFWPSFFDALSDQSEEDRRTSFRTNRFEGEVRTERSPAVTYLYLGKLRPGADWPDIRNLQGERASLASIGAVGALLEPAYLLPVGITTNFVAIMRSSGGPTWSAIENWLSVTGGYAIGDEKKRLELRPYVRKDALERLQRAQGASRLHMKFDAIEAPDTNPDASAVERAVRELQGAGGGGLSVDIGLSFGHLQPDDAGAQALVSGIRGLLRSPSLKRADATLLVPGDGGLVKDPVDFVRDRITVQVEVGEHQDEEPTPQAVLSAMSDALGTFRAQLPQGAQERT